MVVLFTIPIVAIIGGITAGIVKSVHRQRLLELAQKERIAAIERGVDLEKLPDNPTVRYHLGMAYLKKGDTEKAKQELEKALELKDSFEGAQEAKEALAGLSS